MTPIYDELAQFQRTSEWSYRDVLDNLHLWRERFQFEFKLELPEVVIGVDRISRTCLGQFRRGRNGLGLNGEITLSARHVGDHLAPNQWWRVLGTLLHELLHAWQQEHGKAGKNNYHNVQLREKARSLGLKMDARGYTEYAPAGPFVDLLRQHSVSVPHLAMPPTTPKSNGSSKLKLWICQCPVRVRVAVPTFQARCLTCGHQFSKITNGDEGTR